MVDGFNSAPPSGVGGSKRVGWVLAMVGAALSSATDSKRREIHISRFVIRRVRTGDI